MQIFSLDLYLFYLDLNIVLAPPQTWHWLALWQRGEREGHVRGLGRWKYISALLWLHRLESGTNAMSRRAPPTHTRGRFRARPNHSVPALRMVWTVTREHGGGVLSEGGPTLGDCDCASVFTDNKSLSPQWLPRLSEKSIDSN